MISSSLQRPKAEGALPEAQRNSVRICEPPWLPWCLCSADFSSRCHYLGELPTRRPWWTRARLGRARRRRQVWRVPCRLGCKSHCIDFMSVHADHDSEIRLHPICCEGRTSLLRNSSNLANPHLSTFTPHGKTVDNSCFTKVQISLHVL